MQVEAYEHTFESTAKEWIVSNAHWSDYYRGQVVDFHVNLTPLDGVFSSNFDPLSNVSCLFFEQEGIKE